MTATGASAFTTAERVVDRVHGHAANLGTTTEPAIATGLAQRDIFMLNVANLTNGSQAGRQNLANFSGRHTQQRILPFLGNKLGISSGSTAELTATTGIELDIVHYRA